MVEEKPDEKVKADMMIGGNTLNIHLDEDMVEWLKNILRDSNPEYVLDGVRIRNRLINELDGESRLQLSKKEARVLKRLIMQSGIRGGLEQKFKDNMRRDLVDNLCWSDDLGRRPFIQYPQDREEWIPSYKGGRRFKICDNLPTQEEIKQEGFEMVIMIYLTFFLMIGCGGLSLYLLSIGVPDIIAAVVASMSLVIFVLMGEVVVHVGEIENKLKLKTRKLIQGDE